MKTTLIVVGSLLAVGVIGFVVYKQMHKGGATNNSSTNGVVDSSGNAIVKGDGTPLTAVEQKQIKMSQDNLFKTSGKK